MVIRANEIGAFDLDDIDDGGALIIPGDDDEEDEAKNSVKKNVIRSVAKSQAKAPVKKAAA